MEGFKKMNEYKICSKCGQKKVGSRNAWFQDFTDQPLQCNKCINLVKSLRLLRKLYK